MLRFQRPFLHTWKNAKAFSTSHSFTVDNPYSGDVVCEIPFASPNEAKVLVEQSLQTQRQWGQTSLHERKTMCEKWIEAVELQKSNIARDISMQMGKPLAQAMREVSGTLFRARTMIDLADEALKNDEFPIENGIFRKIVKEPVGVVLVIAPWNYPLLTAVNAIIPAILSGNSVIIKHSPRTPLCGEHYVSTFKEAGAPEHLVSALHANHQTVAEVIASPPVGFVTFTGSVRGGHEVYRTVSKRFLDCTLELGGKDAGYVASDADVESAAAGLVDGAFYNAGQSCCGIERVYVHQSHYNSFLEAAKTIIEDYKIGNPMQDTTTLGPLALLNSVDFLTQQVQEAQEMGARILCGKGSTTDSEGKGRFFSPTLVADCNHSMSIMKDESFGPVLAVTPVKTDAEAVRLMNDSHFGLTSAIYSSDQERCHQLASQLKTGTVFMNRCDYLDPLLPWGGLHNSGKGISLSKYGFLPFTKLKSYNFRL